MFGVLPKDIWFLLMQQHLPVFDVLRLCDLNPAIDKVGYRVLRAMRENPLAPRVCDEWVGEVKNGDPAWYVRKDAAVMKQLSYHLPCFRLTVDLDDDFPGVFLENDNNLRIWMTASRRYIIRCRLCGRDTIYVRPNKFISYLKSNQSCCELN